MRAFLAVLKDSFREAVDSKVFYVLAGLSLLFSVFCLSVGFRKQPYADAVKSLFQERLWKAAAVHLPEKGMKEPPPFLLPEVVSIVEDAGVIQIVLALSNPEEFYTRILPNVYLDPKDLQGSFKYDLSELISLKGEEGFRWYLQRRLHLGGYIPSSVKKDEEGRFVVTCRPLGEFRASGAKSATTIWTAVHLQRRAFSRLHHADPGVRRAEQRKTCRVP